MKTLRVLLVLALVGAVMMTTAPPAPVGAQAQTIKIGLLYDHSGPFSAAGSLNCYRGAKMIIDYVNEHGGVLGKYKIVQVAAKASRNRGRHQRDRAALNVEKVDVLAGIYSSAHAVPLAERWTARSVSLDHEGHRRRGAEGPQSPIYVPAAATAALGEATVQYVAANAQGKLKKAAKDVRAAIIYEDGPYGTGVAASNESEAKKQGMQIVLKEGFSAQAPDLSSLVTKLRASRPDVIFHTGYNPDIALFLRQAKEQGLRTKIYIGHGAGHSQLAKLKEAFGNDVEGFHTADPPASQLIDPKKLKPGLAELSQEMLKRYKTSSRTSRRSSGAPRVDGLNNMWICSTTSCRAPSRSTAGSGRRRWPRPRARRTPRGRTMQGYGVKFHPAGHPMAGQNMRAVAAVFQVVDGTSSTSIRRSSRAWPSRRCCCRASSPSRT